jgi:signal transduction histidine kinase
VTLGPAFGIRRQAIRVALGATLLVAALYVAASVAVVVVVTQNLTAQIDLRLADALNRVPLRADSSDEPYERPSSDRPFGPPTLIWAVLPTGAVLADAQTPQLPEEYARTVGPMTASVGGTELRLQGAAVGDLYVVVGQSLESVTDARSTVVLAEAAIGFAVLLIVFFGAVAVGRRVAEPIEEARRRQMDFTADASHELRTPLSVIEANTSLALAGDRDQGWYRSAFASVDHESKRMRRLLDDMLWLARFDAARKPAGREAVDLGVLAIQTADRFAAIAETRHLQLSVHVADEPAAVAAPSDLIDRLVGVLLDNACKYAPVGGRVDVTVARDGARVSLVVDDSGPGLPVTDRDRIFDRFHRASQPAADQAGTVGAGLGLAIADAIVRATGGRWQLGTAPAGGARFNVSWPRTLG